jgi:glutamyl-tRNA reductase
MVGCSHHSSGVAVREKLAFSRDQAREALSQLRVRYPDSEAVLLSTCNRVELYLASPQPDSCPTHHDLVQFLADFHGLDAETVFTELFEHTGEEFVRHLFTVAASLDSMVIGEAQILVQVKQAYELATSAESTGPLTNAAFQAALRVAKRVTNETAIQQKRVSIPSVAVADYAKQFFERFDDKVVVVIGAGDMGEETLRYLIDEGVRDVRIVNRSLNRAEELVAKTIGQAFPWTELHSQLVAADLVVSATGAPDAVITGEMFKEIVQQRFQRPLLMLDLAIPRDIEPIVGDFTGVYLCSIDDKKEREKEWPKAEKIIEDETARFMADLNHRATAPTIRRLKARADELKAEELQRLLNKLGAIDDRGRDEIVKAFDRLVNKLLHPPLESLRDEAQQGTPYSLLDALKRLFQLKE